MADEKEKKEEPKRERETFAPIGVDFGDKMGPPRPTAFVPEGYEMVYGVPRKKR